VAGAIVSSSIVCSDIFRVAGAIVSSSIVCSDIFRIILKREERKEKLPLIGELERK
jgi:hypothetical protein